MALRPCIRPAGRVSPPHVFVGGRRWLCAISRYRATVSFAPNFAYELCVAAIKDRDLSGVDLSCWRVAGCGQSHPCADLTAFAERFRAFGFREMSSSGVRAPEHVVARRSAARRLSHGRPLAAAARCRIIRLRIVEEPAASCRA